MTRQTVSCAMAHLNGLCSNYWLTVLAVVRSGAGRPGGGKSGGAAADQPDRGGDEQHRQREQPAALDPLEGPEPAAGLIAAPLRVAVPGQALRGRAIEVARAEPGKGADQLGAAGREREPAVLGVPLAHDHAEPGGFSRP